MSGVSLAISWILMLYLDTYILPAGSSCNLSIEMLSLGCEGNLKDTRFSLLITSQTTFLFTGTCLFVGFVCPANSSISSFQTASSLCFSHFILHHRGSDRIYDIWRRFVAVGLNTLFTVLPHWDNMAKAHMLPNLVTLH